MPIEKRPASLVPKGPHAGSRVHKVSDNETFETVARKYGITVSQLILHNFGTANPAELNWYLRHYVGCNLPTHDGKNWRFSNAARPGLIYIPQQVLQMDPLQIVSTAAGPLTASDVVAFLTTNPAISRLNFSFLSYKVYPGAYKTDVADAFSKGEIKIRTGGASSPAAGASYYTNYDSLEVSPTFNIYSWRDQAFLVHECTHAHLDIQDLGKVSGHENEAVAYLAEAMFLEASGYTPLGSQTIRGISHRIAKNLLTTGSYTVSASDASALVAEVAKHPHYKSQTYYMSNGFKRSLLDNLLR